MIDKEGSLGERVACCLSRDRPTLGELFARLRDIPPPYSLSLPHYLAAALLMEVHPRPFAAALLAFLAELPVEERRRPIRWLLALPCARQPIAAFLLFESAVRRNIQSVR